MSISADWDREHRPLMHRVIYTPIRFWRPSYKCPTNLISTYSAHKPSRLSQIHSLLRPQPDQVADSPSTVSDRGESVNSWQAPCPDKQSLRLVDSAARPPRHLARNSTPVSDETDSASGLHCQPQSPADAFSLSVGTAFAGSEALLRHDTTKRTKRCHRARGQNSELSTSSTFSGEFLIELASWLLRQQYSRSEARFERLISKHRGRQVPLHTNEGHQDAPYHFPRHGSYVRQSDVAFFIHALQAAGNAHQHVDHRSSKDRRYKIAFSTLKRLRRTGRRCPHLRLRSTKSNAALVRRLADTYTQPSSVECRLKACYSHHDDFFEAHRRVLHAHSHGHHVKCSGEALYYLNPCSTKHRHMPHAEYGCQCFSCNASTAHHTDTAGSESEEYMPSPAAHTSQRKSRAPVPDCMRSLTKVLNEPWSCLSARIHKRLQRAPAPPFWEGAPKAKKKAAYFVWHCCRCGTSRISANVPACIRCAHARCANCVIMKVTK